MSTPIYSKQLQAAKQAAANGETIPLTRAYKTISRFDHLLMGMLIDATGSDQLFDIKLMGGSPGAEASLNLTCVDMGDKSWEIISWEEFTMDVAGEDGVTTEEVNTPSRIVERGTLEGVIREWTSRTHTWIEDELPSPKFGELPLPSRAEDQVRGGRDVELLPIIEDTAPCPRCQAHGKVASDQFEGVCFQCGGSADALNIIPRAFMHQTWVDLCKRNRARVQMGLPAMGFTPDGQRVTNNPKKAKRRL